MFANLLLFFFLTITDNSLKLSDVINMMDNNLNEKRSLQVLKGLDNIFIHYFVLPPALLDKSLNI